MTKTREELRAEYEQGLEHQRRNLVRHDDPLSARIAAAASERLLSLLPAGGPVRLVASADSMSLVTPATLKRIEEKSGPVALSCYWFRMNATRLPDYPWIVEWERSYVQPVDWKPSACVVFEPVVRERSVARALLLLACDDHPDVPMHLVTFAADRGQVETLCRDIQAIMGDDLAGPVTVHAFGDLGTSDPRWFSAIVNGPMSRLDRLDRTPVVVAEAMAPAVRKIYGIDEDPVAA